MPERAVRLVVCLSIVLAAAAGFALAAYPFADGAEGGAGQWSAAPPWAASAESAHAGSFAFSDSPGANYANNANVALTMRDSLDLTRSARPRLSFWHTFNLEPGYDFGYVEISLDGGASWQASPLASFTGNAAWRREQIDLSAYKTQATVKLRFRLVGDANVTLDGWHVDDVVVDEAPDAPTATAGAVTANTIALSWTASAAADFAGYRVVRSATQGFDWRTATTVASFGAASTTNFTDVALNPKSRYHYRVVVARGNGIEAASDEVSATTSAGMDFPFLDDGEAGAATWRADVPWALSTEAAYGGASAWSDSPGGPYAANVNASLTLAAPLDLRAATRPTLSFRHIYDFPGNDHGLVEVSTDNGQTWTALRDFTNGTVAAWTYVQVDLSAYKAQATLVRFRVTADGATNGDGWHLDDVAVSEPLAALATPTPTPLDSHAIRVAWPQATGSGFDHYEVVRSTSPNAGVYGTIAVRIHDVAATTFDDRGLALNTTYYYRVYAVNRWGCFSPDSAAEAAATTLNNPLPFADGFEGALDAWTFTGGWSKTSVVPAHGGAFVLQDSPGDYANSSDTYAQTAVDLRGALNPALSFWDRFALQQNADFAAVEVSVDGANWSRPYVATGTRLDWARQVIDLSPWRGQANLRIRFRVATDGGTVADGWYIDDVEVQDVAPLPTIPLPFTETFESGLGAWQASRWTVAADAAHGGAASARSSADGNLWSDGFERLVLNGELDLAGSANPQLTFWMSGHAYWCSGFNVYASTDGGATWSGTLFGQGNDWNTSGTWRRAQVDLSAYKGQKTRLMFQVSTCWGGADEDFYIDDVRVEDLPTAVTLAAPTPRLKTAELAWTKSSDPNFARYEVRRSTSPNVTLDGTLVALIADVNTVSALDDNPPEGLAIGATYYYKVFTFDTYGTVTPSNERSATTVPLAYPVADAMDDLRNWVRGTDSADQPTWGPLSPGRDGETGTCIASSPTTDYPNSSSTYILTAVDLTAAVHPLLSFWDLPAFQQNADFGSVEVSVDGANWSRPYVVTGVRAAWARQRIDLTRWRGQTNLRIRFRVATDGGTTNAGWRIDDVTIGEAEGWTAFPFPFTETFESGLGNWQASRWTIAADAVHGGAASVRSSADGNLWNSGYEQLLLNGEIDLAAAQNPQLTFWMTGHAYWCSGFNVYASTDGGATWSGTLFGQGSDWNTSGTWRRAQVDLSGYKGKAVRLLFEVSSCWGGADEDFYVDDVRVEDLPTAVTLAAPTPHLKTAELAWTKSSDPNFARYEVRRSTSPGVTLDGTLVASIADVNTVSALDDNPPEGLAIGATYYYKVFTFDTYGTVTPSNERSAVTVPLPYPVADAMDDLRNWVRGTDSADQPTWGPLSPGRDGATGSCVASSPTSDYPNSSSTYILTAVDLTAAVHPVLSFWDQPAFQQNADYGSVEVSADGNNWQRPYVVTGVRAVWARQRIDLTRWRGQTNLRIRFRVATDGGTTNAGWRIDDVTIGEADGWTTFAFPFTDGFESGLGNWQASRWTVAADAAHGGAASVRSSADGNLWNSGYEQLLLNGQIDLAAARNPQLTFWMTGHAYWCSSLNVYASTDGGATWSGSLFGQGNDWNASGTWRRAQIDLSGYKGQAVRLLFEVASCWGGADEDFSIDDVAVSELPAAPVLAPPDAIGNGSMRLSWSAYADAPSFRSYLLYRDTTNGVGLGSALVATLGDRAATQFVDTGLQAGKTYYYRLYVQDVHDAYSPSNLVSARTAPLVPSSAADDFETPNDHWTMTGTWAVQSGAGRNGGAALVDSIGDYPCGMDASATTSVNLKNASWPVLTFHDRYAYQDNYDWGVVEVMTNEGSSWTRVYTVTGTRPDWRRAQIDLSPWKGQENVWIRFRSLSDGCGIQADGWSIDDFAVVENAHAPLPYPYAQSFEGTLDDLLPSAWVQGADLPKEGAADLVATPGQRIWADANHSFAFAGELDLSAATSPSLSYWIRGHMYWCSTFRFQSSIDGGITWTDVPGTIRGNDWASDATWVKTTVDISPLKNAHLRLRGFLNTCYGGADAVVHVDAVRIGEPTPGAPAPHDPPDGGAVGVLRPTLTLDNALDYQFDPLTYRIQVASDSSFDSTVAEVPAVAEGTTTTSWTVDTDLANNTRYWWRARGRDPEGHEGPWMAPAAFYVVLRNDAPPAPKFVAPPNGAQLWGADAALTWYASVDPNPGDTVTYDLEIDDDPNFGAPEVSATGLSATAKNDLAAALPTITAPLGDLPGYASLVSQRTYYWRLRAVDNRHAASPWTSEVRYFVFGADTTAPTVAWSSPADRATIAATPTTLSGTAQDVGAGLDYVQLSFDGGTTWILAAGGGSWSYSFAPTQNGEIAALVRAADKAGNVSAPASRRFTVALPDIPTAPAAQPDNSMVTVFWGPPALPGATGYNVYRAIESGAFAKLNAAPLATLSYRDAGLINGLAHRYVVTALRGGVESGRSPEVWARPTGDGAPPFVDDVRVARSGGDLRLDWSAATADLGSGAAAMKGYRIYEGALPTVDPATAANNYYVAAPATTFTLSGLGGDGATHFFLVDTVAADDAEGAHARWFREENDPSVALSAGWTEQLDVRASGGRAVASAVKDAAATIPLFLDGGAAMEGTGASLLMKRGPDQGIATILIDGAPAAGVDLYAPSEEWRVWAFHIRGLAAGAHTLRVVVSGDKSPASSGATVTFDAVLHLK